ncbi:protein THEM6-like [Lineus longissimus]|uniref:protein THEM6-like n=1 Tax=Lineus longissimus TaxID=88925 RepID=UPI002B4F3144
MDASVIWVAIVVAGILSLFFDIHYFAYSVIVLIGSTIKRQISHKNFQLENFHYGFCFSTDLDFMLHMNNARYLRECDFGRFCLYTRTGVWGALKKLGGSMTLGASTIRYRKSINFLCLYQVRTKIVCWDEKAFYLEQTFIRPSDKFVYAIALIKQSVIKVPPKDVVQAIQGVETESPDFPEEIKKWIECNQISSEKLRNGKDK